MRPIFLFLLLSNPALGKNAIMRIEREKIELEKTFGFDTVGHSVGSCMISGPIIFMSLDITYILLVEQFLLNFVSLICCIRFLVQLGAVYVSLTLIDAVPFWVAILVSFS